jgi:hypothetical protein
MLPVFICDGPLVAESKVTYITKDGNLAVWTGNTRIARNHLGNLGFFLVSDEDTASFEEGERRLREISVVARNREAAAAAKAHYGFRCIACDFSFEDQYGSLGIGFIECHHIDPLSGRDGRNTVTSIKNLTVLCSDCHRMIHRKKPALTIAELKQLIRHKAKKWDVRTVPQQSHGI